MQNLRDRLRAKQNAHGEAAGVRRFLAHSLTWRQYAANDHGINQLYSQNTKPSPPSQGAGKLLRIQDFYEAGFVKRREIR